MPTMRTRDLAEPLYKVRDGSLPGLSAKIKCRRSEVGQPLRVVLPNHSDLTVLIKDCSEPADHEGWSYVKGSKFSAKGGNLLSIRGGVVDRDGNFSMFPQEYRIFTHGNDI